MKPTQFAKGFKARPDTTSSEKRTALDRINAIDEIVNQEAGNDKQVTGRSSAYAEDEWFITSPDGEAGIKVVPTGDTPVSECMGEAAKALGWES